ncbi:MAG TPA: DUF6600 domain-containing protein [Polyangiaceae bacterium]
MRPVKIERLLFVDREHMILSVTPRFFHRAVRVLAGLLAVALSAGSVAAQDSGWFDAGRQAPGQQPITRTQQVTTSQGPADPRANMEPLPESPLLDESGAQGADEDRDPRALTAWNRELDPYGVWIDDPSYGRVWIPNAAVVGTSFSPYVTGGHWALDEGNEWIWVSEYPFGRVVFHYGRWVWISGRGWAWVPGLKYAPAWVTWRVPVDSYAYVGWAPIPPSYVWFGGVSVWWGYPLYYPWVFCPSAYVFYPHVHHHVIHDHHGQAHAAHHTRPYYPQRGYVRQPPRGPAPSAAQVPPGAVPRDRVSARQVAAAPNPALGLAGPATRRDTVDGRKLPSLTNRPDLTSTGARSRTTPSYESTRQVQRASEFSRPSVDRRSFDRTPMPRVSPMRSSPSTPRLSPGRISPGPMRMPRR